MMPKGGLFYFSIRTKLISLLLLGGAMSSVPEDNLPRDNLSLPREDTTGSTANIPSKAPALVQDDAATSIQGSDILLFNDN